MLISLGGVSAVVEFAQRLADTLFPVVSECHYLPIKIDDAANAFGSCFGVGKIVACLETFSNQGAALLFPVAYTRPVAGPRRIEYFA